DFQVVEEISDGELYYIRFENEDEFFYISQGSILSAKQKRIDTENSEIESIEIDGHQGFYAGMDDKQVIYLEMGNISICIYGNIGKKEMFQMADNLELLKK